MKRLARVARWFLQTAFARLSKSLQAEWQYALRVLPGTESAFKPIEATLADDFLPALFGLDPGELDAHQDLLALPTKSGGIGVLDPTKTSSLVNAALVCITKVLTDTLMLGGPEFSAEHSSLRRKSGLIRSSRTTASWMRRRRWTR